MTYQLRDYQSDLLDRVDKAWFSGHRSILCQLPTGGSFDESYCGYSTQASNLFQCGNVQRPVNEAAVVDALWH